MIMSKLASNQNLLKILPDLEKSIKNYFNQPLFKGLNSEVMVEITSLIKILIRLRRTFKVLRTLFNEKEQFSRILANIQTYFPRLFECEKVYLLRKDMRANLILSPTNP